MTKRDHKIENMGMGASSNKEHEIRKEQRHTEKGPRRFGLVKKKYLQSTSKTRFARGKDFVHDGLLKNLCVCH